MLILAPHRKIPECRGFVFDLIDTMKPDIVIIDYPAALDNPENVNERYRDSLEGVIVIKARLKDAIVISSRHPDKKVLILITCSILVSTLQEEPELRPFVKSRILYPSPAELAVDINTIINAVEGIA